MPSHTRFYGTNCAEAEWRDLSTKVILQAIINEGAMTKSYSGEFSIRVHPGAILQEMLDEKGVSQSELARHLHTDIARINEICRQRRGISAEIAVMLGKAFGSSAALWLNLQANWELSQVDPRAARSIRPLRASA
jgi:addiction module HigA family antidote